MVCSGCIQQLNAYYKNIEDQKIMLKHFKTSVESVSKKVTVISQETFVEAVK